MKNLAFLSLLLFVPPALSLQACASPASEAPSGRVSEDLVVGKGAQMNDLSVLFPMAKSRAEFDAGYLAASAIGRGGPLLPSSLYVSATGSPLAAIGPLPPGSDAGLPYSALRMAAFRVDPCFGQIGPITDLAQCKYQLRIVFQPLSFSEATATTLASTSAMDGAIHAFYSLTLKELTSLMGELIQARLANGGDGPLGPLAVHPILATQGLQGMHAHALRAIVLKYAGSQNLTRFTMFISRDLQTRWDFQGFDVANEVTKPMEIAALPPRTTLVSYSVGSGGKLFGAFVPATMSPDNMQLLGNLSRARAASESAQKSALNAALKIENPNIHSAESIDCASCHMAGPGRSLTAMADLRLSVGGNPNAFRSDPKFISLLDMAQTTPIDLKNGLNVHMFSYRGTEPMIAQRVINETASFVAYVNENLLRSIHDASDDIPVLTSPLDISSSPDVARESEASLAIDPASGAMVAVWYATDLTNLRKRWIVSRKSFDSGRTWSAPQRFRGSHEFIRNNRAMVVADKKGNFFVTWMELNDPALPGAEAREMHIFAATMEQGADFFGPPIAISDPLQPNIPHMGDTPMIAVDAQDNVLVTWPTAGSVNGAMFAVSSDAGKTFTPPMVASERSSNPIVCIDPTDGASSVLLVQSDGADGMFVSKLARDRLEFVAVSKARRVGELFTAPCVVKGENLSVIVKNTGRDGREQVALLRSADGGRTFAKKQVVAEAESQTKYDLARFQIAADGTIVAIYVKIPVNVSGDKQTGPASLMWAVSKNDGKSFSRSSIGLVGELLNVQEDAHRDIPKFVGTFFDLLVRENSVFVAYASNLREAAHVQFVTATLR